MLPKSMQPPSVNSTEDLQASSETVKRILSAEKRTLVVDGTAAKTIVTNELGKRVQNNDDTRKFTGKL